MSRNISPVPCFLLSISIAMFVALCLLAIVRPLPPGLQRVAVIDVGNSANNSSTIDNTINGNNTSMCFQTDRSTYQPQPQPPPWLPLQLPQRCRFALSLLNSIHTSPYVDTPYVLFLTGVLEFNYITLVPCLVTFLMIERILIIKTSLTGPKWPSKLLLICAICTLIAIWFGDFASYMTELPLQLDRVGNCKVAACQAIRTLSTTSLYIKAAFGSTNLVCCALFLHTLKSTEINLNARVVKWTIATELMFGTLPCFSTIAFNSITGLSPTTYIGESGAFFNLLDTCFGSVIYWRILTKRGTQIGATQSTHTSRNQMASGTRLNNQMTPRAPPRNMMVSNLQ